MSKLAWDQSGDKVFETGTKKGVLYPWMDAEGTPGTDGYKAAGYRQGYAWNGLTAVTESPDGAEETALYADDIKYLSMRSAEEFNFTIEAYTYPDAWAQCDGSANLVANVPGVTVGQQKRRMFGFSYVSTVGNDTEGNDYGEKIHLIYGATAAPSERAYETINDSPEAITFSWECNTTAIDMPGGLKRAAEITIDTTRLNEAGRTALTTLKNALYGTDNAEPYLPTPAQVFEMFGGDLNAAG